jgi:hypothetical protein
MRRVCAVWGPDYGTHEHRSIRICQTPPHFQMGVKGNPTHHSQIAMGSN